jgi:hypothetical protein
MLRRLILVIACLGTLLFSGVFLVSWLHPIALERIAREAVRLEVERRVGERIESLSGSRMVAMAQKAMGRTDEEVARIRKQLADNVPATVAEITTKMLNKDCECRHKLERQLRRSAQRAGARGAPRGSSRPARGLCRGCLRNGSRWAAA